MKTKIILTLLFLISTTAFTQDIVNSTGRVEYFTFEGGFYGIIGDDGINYEPMNLPVQFQEQGCKIKFKGLIRTDVMSIHNWGTIIELLEVELYTEDKSYFEIYEWGVMLGCYNDNVFYNTSRPVQITVVKQPVIYVHSNDDIKFDVKVEFKSGKPEDTYPKVDTDGKTIYWYNVYAHSREEVEKRIINENDWDLVPLKDIIGILNKVDSKCLEFNNVHSKFLFYEGEMEFENKVLVDFDTDLGAVLLANNFDFTIYNVTVTKQLGSFLDPEYVMCHIDSMAAGEKVAFRYENIRDVWTEDLIKLGFSKLESESFTKLWFTPFTQRTNQGGWANLIYRLPECEVEKLISLEINPKPTLTRRVLYTLITIDKIK
ncbi:MAG: hypothetical protein N2490_03290 [Ignavibacteria bacterium]|nr:hypothetical protein [Ignavibacteria bacterium]